MEYILTPILASTKSIYDITMQPIKGIQNKYFLEKITMLKFYEYSLQELKKWEKEAKYNPPIKGENYLDNIDYSNQKEIEDILNKVQNGELDQTNLNYENFYINTGIRLPIPRINLKGEHFKFPDQESYDYDIIFDVLLSKGPEKFRDWVQEYIKEETNIEELFKQWNKRNSLIYKIKHNFKNISNIIDYELYQKFTEYNKPTITFSFLDTSGRDMHHYDTTTDIEEIRNTITIPLEEFEHNYHDKKYLGLKIKYYRDQNGKKTKIKPKYKSKPKIKFTYDTEIFENYKMIKKTISKNMYIDDFLSYGFKDIKIESIYYLNENEEKIQILDIEEIARILQKKIFEDRKELLDLEEIKKSNQLEDIKTWIDDNINLKFDNIRNN